MAATLSKINDRGNKLLNRVILEGDPLVKGWEKNPAYQQEDGRFGH
jgi:hypothetical protein